MEEVNLVLENIKPLLKIIKEEGQKHYQISINFLNAQLKNSTIRRTQTKYKVNLTRNERALRVTDDKSAKEIDKLVIRGVDQFLLDISTLKSSYQDLVYNSQRIVDYISKLNQNIDSLQRWTHIISESSKMVDYYRKKEKEICEQFNDNGVIIDEFNLMTPKEKVNMVAKKTQKKVSKKEPATTLSVEELLKALEKSTDPIESKKIRKSLRTLGHVGGLGRRGKKGKSKDAEPKPVKKTKKTKKVKKTTKDVD